MDSSANPGDVPPGYTEHIGMSGVPYGQSTMLHGNENTLKIHQDQPGPIGPVDAPYPPSDAPSQYPGPPGYESYGATPYGYAMGPGYPPPGYGGVPAPQHQQQSVVVVTGERQRGPVMIAHVQSYAGHIVLACFVTWCCCFIFGIIAFILAGIYISHTARSQIPLH